ncbi:cyclomaltodextrin glucanotransferase [Lysobacter sp. A6]|uniref:Cyclomaltodextrin glucanotransferase n=1 Tax=Noviluteimonas lactosilytica TaxID=2888523 RepID=A0ABS8JJD8_9GAMM|nr:alpha-amylase family glycosyl hydrolase [Lysobacter lactosilyticus]MCC8363667.1 cyclomaltodextrin glucanotransferase [Lysobacter lactosilyticus]
MLASKRPLAVALGVALIACACKPSTPPAEPQAQAPAQAPKPVEYYGTTEPFAADAVYFLMTDRFVNGDESNDHRDQAAKNPKLRTFDRPTPGAPKGKSDNVGYMGGDFRGVLDNANYIRDMGFGAVWITPIVDQPDEAFTGGEPVKWAGFWTDGGKTGYHGYWGVNFYKLDEHLPSKDLDFRGLAKGLKSHGLKTVLDIVANHGSPSFTMPKDQPKFGEIYDRDGKLVADHMNLAPEKLDPANPLNAFYNRKPGIAQLSDLNENDPRVLPYLLGAYEQWIGQGADAFRIDTIGWMPHSFWHAFSTKIREKHPGFFMFGEAFEYDAAKIAEHTWPENAGVSVLDFPLQKAMGEAFGGATSGKPAAGYERIAEALHLTSGPYANPYDLMTFYDNHDMPRIDATDDGFVDANNALFTLRGIPVVYYGSETGFERGTAEHAGNRNYYGQERVDAGKDHRIWRQLRRIANVRKQVPALQRGLQVNVEMQGDRAAFYRVLQQGEAKQIALVLLNKGETPAQFSVRESLQAGQWKNAFDATTVDVAAGGAIEATVAPHDVAVFVLDGATVTDATLTTELDRAMARARRRVD